MSVIHRLDQASAQRQERTDEHREKIENLGETEPN
jgi:hypothetical protein